MGKNLADLKFSNRLFKSCPFLGARVRPQPLKHPQVIHYNKDLMQRLGLNLSLIDSPSFLRFCNGDLEFDGVVFGATVYSGHQFGHYIPQLGDGRALMIGEIESPEGHFEFQLKGSGLTPFSRMGDGRAVVRSSIREYLASAHLKALGVPTTEALSVIKGEDDVYRENVEKGAIVVRVAPSFLRFGHFQYFSRDEESLKALVEFTIDHYFSEYSSHPNRYVLFFQDVIKRTAKLFAQWQAIGFAHGVLNTDNTSILGLTIDYGPFGFIENLDLDFICNHSDHEGRYSFGNQAPIGLWNLTRLGEALSLLINSDDQARSLQTYPGLFHFEYQRIMRAKCGLTKQLPGDEDFLRDTLNMLVETNCDYTQFFRSLCYFNLGDQKLKNIPDHAALKDWLVLYEQRLQKEESRNDERKEQLLTINPKFILRNHLAQQVIDDHKKMDDLFKVLSSPYEEWPEFEEWGKPTPPEHRSIAVSCSS